MNHIYGSLTTLINTNMLYGQLYDLGVCSQKFNEHVYITSKYIFIYSENTKNIYIFTGNNATFVFSIQSHFNLNFNWNFYCMFYYKFTITITSRSYLSFMFNFFRWSINTQRNKIMTITIVFIMKKILLYSNFIWCC